MRISADALNTVSNYTESKEEEENKDDVSDDDEEDESQVYVEYESDNEDDWVWFEWVFCLEFLLIWI